MKDEKAALEKPVDLEEEKQQSDGEILEKGKTMVVILVRTRGKAHKSSSLSGKH